MLPWQNPELDTKHFFPLYICFRAKIWGMLFPQIFPFHNKYQYVHLTGPLECGSNKYRRLIFAIGKGFDIQFGSHNDLLVLFNLTRQLHSLVKIQNAGPNKLLNSSLDICQQLSSPSTTGYTQIPQPKYFKEYVGMQILAGRYTPTSLIPAPPYAQIPSIPTKYASVAYSAL